MSIIRALAKTTNFTFRAKKWTRMTKNFSGAFRQTGALHTTFATEW